MMRNADTLFARLFGIFLLAIVLAHLLAFAWFEQGKPPSERQNPPPPRTTPGEPGGQPPGPRPPDDRPPPKPGVFGGPWIPFASQSLALVIAAWIGARLLTRPIRRLSQAAERLSENLDSLPMNETGPAEVRQAAHSFNRMQARIREQVEQRSRMLTAVSHDLRTPLARMKLRVEQVENEALRDRLAQDLGEMNQMLEATLSYLREQRSQEEAQLFDLQALAESLAENAQDQGADVQVEGHCRPVRAQPMALRSCLGNLLGNALRYAGHAHIQLLDGEQEIEVRVIDRGPGIPEDKREAVFEPFFRLESSRNRNSGGVGLGLSIALEASKRLGGSLALKETPGGGLTAILRLPRA
ncbi:two-component sensor histidine kinase [Pseudomonas sp. PIC25]|uniref:ATP-binding protein n=1 Tax=Pseudomonas sp. PIC25 TaxID=1958773 RepID=UPI000BABA74A|nr:ATP-binding protein [Pseudomonas sp. PIC25]PAU65299.1 two-component sensor histidine kinase [Pseudomonas sp. PIC25]